MSIRDISTQQHLLKPLQALFGDLHPDKEIHYLEAFKNATDTELKSIFEYIRDTHQFARFPTIADLQKARKETARKTPAGTSRAYGDFKHPWDLREENRNEAVLAYCKGFEQGTLAFTAAQEGWKSPLMKYVRAAADVQIQLIMPGPAGHLAWDGMALFGVHASNHPDFRRRLQEFMTDCRQQAATGRIDVQVPQYRIDAWRHSVLLPIEDREKCPEEAFSHPQATTPADTPSSRLQGAFPAQQTAKQIATYLPHAAPETDIF